MEPSKAEMTPADDFESVILESFRTLPFAYKEIVLQDIGDVIRRVQAINPDAGKELQKIYDRFYLDIEKMKADQAFGEQGGETS